MKANSKSHKNYLAKQWPTKETLKNIEHFSIHKNLMTSGKKILKMSTELFNCLYMCMHTKYIFLRIPQTSSLW